MQSRPILVLTLIVAGGVIAIVVLISSRGPGPDGGVQHPVADHQVADHGAPAPTNTASSDGPMLLERTASPAATLPPTSVTENPALRTFIDKSASPRFSSDFEARVPTISQPTDIAWMVYVLRDHTDLDAVRNEAANLLRRSRIPDVDQHLLAVLESPLEKGRFQSYAAQHLGDRMRELRASATPGDSTCAQTIHTALVQALSNPHFMVRSEALMALSRERDPRAADIIRKGFTDPSWAQGQDLLIRCAKEAGLTDLMPTIRPLAYSTNDVIRIAAVNVLAQWRDEASRPAFEEASRSSVPRLQRAGQLALSLMEQPQQ